MMNKMKLGTKIFAGFMVVLTLLAAVAGLGYTALGGVTERVAKANAVRDIAQEMLQARQNEKDFMLWDQDASVDAARANVSSLESKVQAARAAAATEASAKQMDEVASGIASYKEAFNTMVQINDARDVASDEMEAKAKAALEETVAIQEHQREEVAEVREANLANLQKAASANTDFAQAARDADTLVDDRLAKADAASAIMVAFYELRDDQKNYMITLEDKYHEAVQKEIDQCIDDARTLTAGFTHQDNIDQGERLIAALEGYKKAFQSYLDLRESEEKAVETMRASAHTALNECNQAAADQEAAMTAEIASANRMTILVSVIAFAIGLIGAYLITRGITNPLNRIIQTLNDGATQVQSASGQLAESSQQMSEGASEQASSLEEISASLEEMASMTRQNADSARQADTMTADAKGAAEKGQHAMARMAAAINQIKGSSDETAKIIKTIDEIAFQTNLLALNAAVEAARAGEAGKGFAVVAEEVRSLAQRSAEAAKTTAELIESAQTNAENGVAVSNEVAEVLGQVGDSVGKVTQLVAEVAAASKEQAQGIDQVNTAMSQLDRVTQSNAASSEEAASASEELSAQAASLGDVVSELRGLVEGRRDSGVVPKPRSTVDVRAGRMPVLTNGRSTGRALTPHAGNRFERRQLAATAAHNGGAKVDPESVIPLSDDDLAEF